MSWRVKKREILLINKRERGKGERENNEKQE